VHAVAVIAEIAGRGFTVTITVNVAPGHDPDVGVTVYVAVCAVFVVLVNVPVTLDPLPAAPPVIPPVTTGIPQEYVVPAGTIPFDPFTGVELKAVPLHVVAVMAVILGTGLTVTGTEIAVPTQPDAVGVTVYVTDCVVLVVFVSTSVIVAPDPPEVVSPVILPLAVVDHAKVVPPMLEDKLTPVGFPEQIV
jgi:hypothetical protein